jgi:hypothetical protein
MSAPSLSVEALLAGQYPAVRFNQRERKLLESVKAYVDTATGSGSVVLADLAAGIAPSHVVKFAGKVTTLIADTATKAVTITGVAATDIVVASIQANPGAETLVTAAPTTNTVTLVFSGAPGAGVIVSYLVLRAAS